LNDASVKDRIRKLSNFAANAITESRRKGTNLQAALKVARIVKAESQVVAGNVAFFLVQILYFVICCFISSINSGVIFHITLRLKEVGCQEPCIVEICDVKIFEQVWTNTTELTSHECKVQLPRAKLLGGLQDIPADSPQLTDILNFAVSEINKDTKLSSFHKLGKVSSAKTQVVAGFNYILTLSVLPTDCTKEAANLKGAQNCRELEGKSGVTCNVTVWHKPWMPIPMELTRISC
jgi:hypothetical protein